MNLDERKKLLDLYSGLRVCDVRDALDAMGYFHYGSVDPAIRPLWRTRAYGPALTVRYLPYRGPTPALAPRVYRDSWSGMYYQEICTYPWTTAIRPGDFVMIDQSGMNVGLIGSSNSFGCYNAGMHGLASNGGIRDTDEIIIQKIPCWSRSVAQTMVQVRLQFDAFGVPIAFGGVQVRQGDMVVADGDGMIVVPAEIAQETALYANEEHENDKKDRRKHYDMAGRSYDETLN